MHYGYDDCEQSETYVLLDFYPEVFVIEPVWRSYDHFTKIASSSVKSVDVAVIPAKYFLQLG